MNRSDIPRVVAALRRAAQDIEDHGRVLWDATYDWQSPLRSGGARGPKGDHADPTLGSVLAPDPLALEHGELKKALRLGDAAASAVSARIHRLLPIDPDSIDRSRRNGVAACIVCSGPAVPARRGMCNTCHRAWLRDDRPGLEEFKRARQRRLEEEARVVHEHEVAS